MYVRYSCNISLSQIYTYSRVFLEKGLLFLRDSKKGLKSWGETQLCPTSWICNCSCLSPLTPERSVRPQLVLHTTELSRDKSAPQCSIPEAPWRGGSLELGTAALLSVYSFSPVSGYRSPPALSLCLSSAWWKPELPGDGCCHCCRLSLAEKPSTLRWLILTLTS